MIWPKHNKPNKNEPNAYINLCCQNYDSPFPVLEIVWTHKNSYYVQYTPIANLHEWSMGCLLYAIRKQLPFQQILCSTQYIAMNNGGRWMFFWLLLMPGTELLTKEHPPLWQLRQMNKMEQSLVYQGPLLVIEISYSICDWMITMTS